MRVLILMAAALVGHFVLAQGGAGSQEVDAAEARRIIFEGNRKWGKARVDYDRATMENMVSADFFVQIGDQRITREDFLNQVSRKSSAATLVRFDVEVLTVNQRGDHWAATIAEKLEIDRPGADGKRMREYALWVTRDGWKKTEAGWRVIYSEAVGNETWRNGTRPPMADW